MAQIMMALGGAPASPPTGYSTMYAKTDGAIYIKDSAGTESPLGGGATAGVAALNGLTSAVMLAAGTNVTITPSGNTLTIASTGGGSTGVPYIDCTGTVDAMVATFVPAITSLTDGLLIAIGPLGANLTTTPTVNVNGLGSKVIVKGNNAPLLAGDIPGSSSQPLLVYNSGIGSFVLINPLGGTGTVTGPGNTTSGYVATWNNTTGTLLGTGIAAPASGTLIATSTALGTNPVIGTPDATKYLRGDGTWATVTGFVGSPGTSTDNYVPTWNGTLGATLRAGLAAPTSGTILGSMTAPATNPVSGTPNSSNYLRGDGTWASPPGGGTVTNTGGSLTTNRVVLGAGTADTKVVTGITTDGISILTLGNGGSAVGAVQFYNATSGTVTLQPITGALGSATATLPAGGYLISSTSNLSNNPVTGTPTISNFLRGDGTWAVPVAGSGTVTHTAGNLTLNALVVGAGGADIATGTNISTDGASTFVVGVAGATPAQVRLFNNSSGYVGLTPPSGVLSNVLSTVPNGTGTLISSVTAPATNPVTGTPSSANFLRGDGTWAAPAGGSGTVTNTGGNLTSNAVVLGAGTVDTKVVTGITTDGATKINLGNAGFAAGGVVFSNATSGTITLAPPTGALGSITATLPINGGNLGYLEIPQNNQNAAYQLVAADSGKLINMASAGAFTIPAYGTVAFPLGTTISFYNPSAACTIAITTDTLIWSPTGGTGTRTLAQYGLCTITKVVFNGSPDKWVITGTGLT